MKKQVSAWCRYALIVGFAGVMMSAKCSRHGGCPAYGYQDDPSQKFEQQASSTLVKTQPLKGTEQNG